MNLTYIEIIYSLTLVRLEAKEQLIASLKNTLKKSNQ